MLKTITPVPRAVGLCMLCLLCSCGNPGGKTAGGDDAGIPQQLENPRAAKAEVYKFYSHVQVVDGYYSCDATSGKEIGMDEETFRYYLEDMHKTNEAVRKFRDQGMEVNLPEINEDILNTLLD